MSVKLKPKVFVTASRGITLKSNRIFVSYAPTSAPETVNISADTSRELTTPALSVNISADTNRAIIAPLPDGKLRYTNKGVIDDLLGSYTYTDPTQSTYSTTGTAVFGTDIKQVSLEQIGLTGANEIWMRWDIYDYKNTCNGFKVLFDGQDGRWGVGEVDNKSGSMRIGSMGLDSAPVPLDKYKLQQINKCVLHVSPSIFQYWLNDELLVDKTGLSQGTKITGIWFKPCNLSPNTQHPDWNSMVSNLIIANYDCSSETLGKQPDRKSAEVIVDTKRQIAASSISSADSLRNIKASIEVSADAVRYITSDVVAVLLADTVRNIAVSNAINGSTARTLKAGNTIATDTARRISADISISVDTLRRFVIAASISADTVRKIATQTRVIADTSRGIPFIAYSSCSGAAADSSVGLQSVNISIQPQSLSDSFSMTTTQKMEVLDSIRGKILDYDYSYTVEQTQWQGIVQQVQGMIDVDQTLYTPFKYDCSGAGKMASHHADRIADAIGKHLDAHFDDFQPSSDMSGTGATYQNLISTIWGWTSRVPRRLINAYIRNDTLHIIQRGCEPNHIDITNTEHTVPNYTHKIVRSVWSGDGNANAHSDDESLEIGPMYFTGTISGPHGSMSYSNGLLTHETHDGNSTTYGYTDVEDGYMTGKRTTNEDGTVIETIYNYAGVIGNKYLESEVEYTKQPDEKLGSKETVKITYHRYLGNGWWETSVYQDGEYQGASMGQGVPGSKASRFVREEAMHFAGRPSGGSGILLDTEFPVVGRGFLETLTHEIEDFNRCIEETVSMVIYNYGHLIDYTDRVVYDGQEYFLESNEYSRDPRTEKQSITLVRWFKR